MDGDVGAVNLLLPRSSPEVRSRRDLWNIFNQRSGGGRMVIAVRNG